MEVTSLEQSKALLESGLKRERCDLWWIERWVGEWVGNDEEGNNREYDEKPVVYLSFVNEAMYGMSGDKMVTTPAWSLGKVMSMLKIKDASGADFSVSSGGWEADSAEKEVEFTDKWFATYEDENVMYCESDESIVGAVVKLILKLKQEGIEI